MSEIIRFTDGAAYERYMGVWSRAAGEAFLQWLSPASGLRWLDVGCGNGAFTALILERCAPEAVEGVDPSEEQLAFARRRFEGAPARFQVGDAQALPFDAAVFGATVMPLVLFFVPDPSKGLAEMVRVARPGGLVAAYCWDMPGGGFPYAVLIEELRALGVAVPAPPHPEVSEASALRVLWTAAGLRDVEVRVIPVERRFAGFEEYWEVVQGASSMGPKLAAMAPEEKRLLRDRVRARLGANDGPLVLSARAHAVRGVAE